MSGGCTSQTVANSDVRSKALLATRMIEKVVLLSYDLRIVNVYPCSSIILFNISSVTFQ